MTGIWSVAGRDTGKGVGPGHGERYRHTTWTQFRKPGLGQVCLR